VSIASLYNNHKNTLIFSGTNLPKMTIVRHNIGIQESLIHITNSELTIMVK
jgi:hypothetical protein